MSDNLTAEKILDLYWQLKPKQPIPIAIWFVDRPREYAIVSAGRGVNPSPFALRIVDFRHAFSTDEERQRLPWFVSQPGIWIEMSDGKHALLKLEGDADLVQLIQAIYDKHE